MHEYYKVTFRRRLDSYFYMRSLKLKFYIWMSLVLTITITALSGCSGEDPTRLEIVNTSSVEMTTDAESWGTFEHTHVDYTSQTATRNAR